MPFLIPIAGAAVFPLTVNSVSENSTDGKRSGVSNSKIMKSFRFLKTLNPLPVVSTTYNSPQHEGQARSQSREMKLKHWSCAGVLSIPFGASVVRLAYDVSLAARAALGAGGAIGALCGHSMP